MLLNRSTARRDGATGIEKIFPKAAPERERPNRSVVKILENVFSIKTQNITHQTLQMQTILN